MIIGDDRDDAVKRVPQQQLPAATTWHQAIRIQVVGNDVELIAPNGSRYDVIVMADGSLVLAPIGEQ